MRKILILGGSGMLGHKLAQVFDDVFDTYCTVRDDGAWFKRLGILPPERVLGNVSAEDFDTIEKTIRTLKPDVVINAIGIIKQLASSQDVFQTLAANSILPRQLANLAELMGFRFVSFSTDCVFTGLQGNYNEGDRPDSADLYGMSKFLGEVTSPNCLTLRTSIIGREIGTAHSLVEWFLSQETSVKGYANAIFSGFPTIVLAELLTKIVNDFPLLEGLYHVSSDPISKFDLLNLIKDRMDLSTPIERFEDFRIDRSLDSTRFREATGLAPLPWIKMVDRMFSDPTPYGEFCRPG